MVLFYGTVLAMRTKVGTIEQNSNVIDGVNLRAEAKRFTHRRCKVLTSCQFLDDAKIGIIVKNSSVNSPIYRFMKFSRNFEKLWGSI